MRPPDRAFAAEADARVAADAEAAAELATRLEEAASGLAAVRAELTDALLDVDAALGVGDSAGAFREGFTPAVASVAQTLRDAEIRLSEHRRALVAGVDGLVGTDLEVSASIGRADAS